MAQCVYCKAQTQLFSNGTPTCKSCAETFHCLSYDRLPVTVETTPSVPPTSQPESTGLAASR
jgi:hypothetical protein